MYGPFAFSEHSLTSLSLKVYPFLCSKVIYQGLLILAGKYDHNKCSSLSQIGPNIAFYFANVTQLRWKTLQMKVVQTNVSSSQEVELAMRSQMRHGSITNLVQMVTITAVRDNVWVSFFILLFSYLCKPSR